MKKGYKEAPHPQSFQPSQLEHGNEEELVD